MSRTMSIARCAGVALLAGLLTVATGAPPAHSAVLFSNEHAKIRSALAVFHGVDSTGCVHTQAIVAANEETYSTTGVAKEKDRDNAFVVLDVFDECVGAPLLQGLGIEGPVDFSPASSLAAATLKADLRVPLFKGPAPETLIHIDVSFAATGSADTVKQNSNELFGALRFISTFGFSRRPATATGIVTASIGINFAPAPSDEAFVEATTHRTILLERA